MAQDVEKLLTARWFKPLTFKNPWDFGLVTFPTFEWVRVTVSLKGLNHLVDPDLLRLEVQPIQGAHKMGEGGCNFRGSISGPTIYTSESSHWKMIRNRGLEALFLVAVLGLAIHFSNGLVSFHHFTTSEFFVASLRSRVPRWLRQAVRAFSEM